jgi:hypothetical protein
VDRSELLTLSLVVVGLGLIALPVLAPPDVPDDRVEFYVESDWMNNADQQTLRYTNFSDAERDVFDAARRATPQTLNKSVDSAPERLTPEANGIAIYNVEHDGEFYLLQVKHITHEVDFLTQQLPRLAALALGAIALCAAGYRRFGR